MGGEAGEFKAGSGDDTCQMKPAVQVELLECDDSSEVRDEKSDTNGGIRRSCREGRLHQRCVMG